MFISLFLSFLQILFLKIGKPSIKIYPPRVPVECGSMVDVRCEFSDFRIIPGLSVKINVDFEWKDRNINGSVYIRPGDNRSIINLPAVQRGRFKSDGPYFAFSDAAGFFNFKTLPLAEESLDVFSSEKEPENLMVVPGLGGDAESRTRLMKRSRELFEVRPYYPGDDLRRLNWKVYAHFGELLVRIGEQLPDPRARVIVVPDFSGPVGKFFKAEAAGQYIDYLVMVLSGIVRRLNDVGKSVNILLPCGRLAETSSLSYTSNLWWGDSHAGDKISSFGKSSVLLLSSAFSVNAEILCESACNAGFPLTAAVVLPPTGNGKKERSLISRLFFTGEGSVDITVPESVFEGAGRLAEALSEKRGVINASLI